MKIIYLHDPKVGESVLPQLEETFPMLEIVAIDLDDDFDQQFEELKKLLGQFTFTTLTDYAIIADGFGIAYASFFTGIRVKGQTRPKVTILINPDYHTVRINPAFKKIPKEDYFGNEVDCLYFLQSLSIFSFDNYNLLSYHQKHHGGNYLLLAQSDILSAIKELIVKSAINRVTINYLKTPVLTPQGQILPPDYPIISVDGSFDWFGEKIFNSRIPNLAFKFRDTSCHGPSRLYLLKGDVIANDLEEKQRHYKYMGNSVFLNIDTGEHIDGQRAPFASWGFPGNLPDWDTVWSIQEQVMYKICVPSNTLKKPSRGYDKFGNVFKVMAIGYDVIILWRQNKENGAVKKHTACPKEEYVAGVLPNSGNPKQIYLLSYGYEGIMVFSSTSKIKLRLALKVVAHCCDNGLTKSKHQDK